MTRLPTAFAHAPASLGHDTGPGHPEHAGRLSAILDAVASAPPSLTERLVVLEEAAPVDDGVLHRAHTAEHVERIRATCREAEASGRIRELDPDTRVSPGSWEAAIGSVGMTLAAARAVASGECANAFVATRPPGHHATPDRPMGFCLFNTVALVARALQAEGRSERVLIVDWDVHHGNGTQDIFWEDPTVAFLSLHMWPHWPGTGAVAERGAGAGEGTTWNVPLPARIGPAAYHAAFDAALDRIDALFHPDIVLVSSGFDALAGDPLGGLRLEPHDYRRLTRRLVALAEAQCGGRVVAVLEGGYDPARTGRAAVELLHGLTGTD